MTPPVKSQEFDGSTVDEAIKKAITALNVSRENLNIKIVCEEQKGLFGMQGAKLAKIKVSKK
ncbi:MAG: Jag N-terminal domain-containing protein [Candidatus Omnitrophota bacterium]